MKLITAAEANDLIQPTLEERLAPLDDLIRTAVAKRERKIHLHDKFWTYGGYGQEPQWKEAKAYLEKLGYRVTFYYNEGQFVDMYTIVEW